MKVMELWKKNLRPRDIATLPAFKNAMAVDMALGCSTNTVLHLPAIAHEAKIKLDLRLFNTMSDRTPHLCFLSPAGPHHMQDLDAAGGVPAVMRELTKLGVIDKRVLTATGKTLGQNLRGVKVKNYGVIKPIHDPYHPEGGIAILRGNLAPGGAVVKQSAVAPEMMVNEGRAIVFESEEETMEAILKGKVKPGHIGVVRYEGPKGGPGMREMLSPTSAIVGMGLDKDVALITDGRFSGGSRGAAIGHISPEAAEGGLIALVKNGDRISIDIPKKKLTLLVSEGEIKRRRKNWKMPQPKIKAGCAARYAQLVTSAGTGAVLKEKI
jgi:dihydroxy-acid dehydratase